MLLATTTTILLMLLAVCTKVIYFLFVIYFIFLSLTRRPISRVEDILYGRQRPPRTASKRHTFYCRLALEAFDGLIYSQRPCRPPSSSSPSSSRFHHHRPIGRWVGRSGVMEYKLRRRDCCSP